MMDLEPIQSSFAFRLARWMPVYYGASLHCLRYLLERLGREETLTTWQEVFEGYISPLTWEILSSGWHEATEGEAFEAERAMPGLLARHFPEPVEGVAPEEAWRLVELAPPLQAIRERFSSVNVWKPISAYEAIHLRLDGFAVLAEAVVAKFGKQGELIFYDLLSVERVSSGGGKTGSAAEFMADFTKPPEEANLFTAGLVIEKTRSSGREVVFQVKQCEWARYFRERHPRVGYLLACSTDEVAYRAFNANLRLQRTMTLMEGGAQCDFRIYST